MRQQGKLIDWYDERGYGFVIRHGETQRVYVHISEFVEGQRRPVGGDALIYDVIPGKGGSLAAINIVLPETLRQEAVVQKTGRGRDARAYFVAAIASGLLVLLTVMGKLAFGVLVWYALASGIAFLTYAADKRAAVDRRRRIPEDQLHAIALLGGWPGALVAQRRFRHKSAKRSFLAMFWATVLVNVAGLVFFLTPPGKHWLAMLARFF
jgi:uncharacterized membrane protein YsdA (DUF1294 family)/cold shock CspA family protein